MNQPKVVHQLINKFGTFTVEELIYEGRPARVLFSGPLHAAQSGIPLDQNPRLLFDYNQCLLDLALELEPVRILVLGGGTMTLPMALLRQLPSAKLTVVEINPDLIKLGLDYFNYRPDRRLRLVEADAAQFMSLARPTYDLVLTDIYDNFTVPAHFRTRQFAEQIERSLQSGGVVATNCIAGLSGESSKP
ncbi:MAG: spermidine synthase, partial [Candidatus Saccharimonadales bacterium]